MGAHESWRLIQRWAGVKDDGIPGAATAAGIIAKAGLTPPSRRRINKAGLDIIKKSEGLRLKAYYCPAGVLTVGFGSTGPHVKPGMVITEAEAEQLLLDDLKRFEDAVAKACPVATSNQFSAMVSLAFNIGTSAFAGSTLAKKHNAGDYAGAAAEFARWNRGGGKVLPGLTKRRAREAQLYRSQS